MPIAALAALGIDLDRVRDAIEQNFGEGALTRAVLANEERRRSSRLAGEDIACPADPRA